VRVDLTCPDSRTSSYVGETRKFSFGYDVEFTEFLNGICEATRASTPAELRQNPSSFFPVPPAED